MVNQLDPDQDILACAGCGETFATKRDHLKNSKDKMTGYMRKLGDLDILKLSKEETVSFSLTNNFIILYPFYKIGFPPSAIPIKFIISIFFKLSLIIAISYNLRIFSISRFSISSIFIPRATDK